MRYLLLCQYGEVRAFSRRKEFLTPIKEEGDSIVRARHTLWGVGGITHAEWMCEDGRKLPAPLRLM